MRFTIAPNVEKALVLEHSGASKKVDKKYLINLLNFDYFGPQTQNGIQNDQKSITFIDKLHMTFHHVGKPYKTNEKRGFSKTQNALRKPL